jgi:hypothetical protein
VVQVHRRSLHNRNSDGKGPGDLRLTGAHPERPRIAKVGGRGRKPCRHGSVSVSGWPVTAGASVRSIQGLSFDHGRHLPITSRQENNQAPLSDPGEYRKQKTAERQHRAGTSRSIQGNHPYPSHTTFPGRCCGESSHLCRTRKSGSAALGLSGMIPAISEGALLG